MWFLALVTVLMTIVIVFPNWRTSVVQVQNVIKIFVKLFNGKCGIEKWCWYIQLWSLILIFLFFSYLTNFPADIFELQLNGIIFTQTQWSIDILKIIGSSLDCNGLFLIQISYRRWGIQRCKWGLICCHRISNTLLVF